MAELRQFYEDISTAGGFILDAFAEKYTLGFVGGANLKTWRESPIVVTGLKKIDPFEDELISLRRAIVSHAEELPSGRPAALSVPFIGESLDASLPSDEPQPMTLQREPSLSVSIDSRDLKGRYSELVARFESIDADRVIIEGTIPTLGLSVHAEAFRGPGRIEMYVCYFGFKEETAEFLQQLHPFQGVSDGECLRLRSPHSPLPRAPSPPIAGKGLCVLVTWGDG